MDIIFNPPNNDENRYIQRLVTELRAKGYNIHPLDSIFSSRAHFRAIKLVHLNWFENIDDTRTSISLRSFFRKLTVLVVIRLTRKPIIWTLHNRMSHEKGSALFSRLISHLLVRWSDRIVIHSRQSEAVLAGYGENAMQRAVYVPHPHFIGAYRDSVSASPRQGGDLQLLFIGMVKPYKNLELLIDVVGTFGSSVQLILAGKALDTRYQRKLARQAAAAGNVTLLSYFIPDDELAGLLGRADAVILPYDLVSSLNSGAAILAFSYKKTVICSEIGTISDLGSRKTDTFCYRYDTEAQHRVALGAQIERALAQKRADPAALRQMGERLYKHMSATHDPRRVGDVLDQIYRDAISRHHGNETIGG